MLQRPVGAEIVAAAPVSQTAPVITGTPAPGGTVTITTGTYSGTPAPTVTGTLTLDGVDVTADLSGLDYAIPASATPGVVLAYSETAGNGIAPDAQQAVSVTVVAAETALLDTYPGAAGAWSCASCPAARRTWCACGAAATTPRRISRRTTCAEARWRPGSGRQ